MPDVYTSDLLTTIAKAESNGNYNAYFGNARNSQVQFTTMTVGQVLEWQRQFAASGQASTAVGRYQFIDTTLQGLVDELGIAQDELFDPTMQDRLANKLLQRRGLYEYVEQKISKEEFAHNLSKEWAALPRVIGDAPTASYYAGDGLNTARLSIEEISKSIETVREL
jgi:conjugal transfer mating pair stabilization protein TraG